MRDFFDGFLNGLPEYIRMGTILKHILRHLHMDIFNNAEYLCRRKSACLGNLSECVLDILAEFVYIDLLGSQLSRFSCACDGLFGFFEGKTYLR